MWFSHAAHDALWPGKPRLPNIVGIFLGLHTLSTGPSATDSRMHPEYGSVENRSYFLQTAAQIKQLDVSSSCKQNSFSAGMRILGSSHYCVRKHGARPKYTVMRSNCLQRFKAEWLRYLPLDFTFRSAPCFGPRAALGVSRQIHFSVKQYFATLEALAQSVVCTCSKLTQTKTPFSLHCVTIRLTPAPSSLFMQIITDVMWPGWHLHH